jgi:type VI protein secretion system component Hcp
VAEYERQETGAEQAAPEAAGPASAAGPGGPVAAVLALQRAAGNRAVGAWLARQDGNAAGGGQEPAKAEPDGYTVVVPEAGTFGVMSWSTSNYTDVTVTKQMDGTSAKLMELAANGMPVSFELRMAKGGKRFMTVRIKGAVISRFSTSGRGGAGGPTETVTFAGKVEVEVADNKRAEGQPDAAQGAPTPAPAP